MDGPPKSSERFHIVRQYSVKMRKLTVKLVIPEVLTRVRYTKYDDDDDDDDDNDDDDDDCVTRSA